MFLNKSVVSSLSMALLLSACSGSDGYGVGNGSPDETGADSGSDSGTDIEIVETLGVGEGNVFQVGEMTVGLQAGEVLEYGGSTTVSVNIVDINDGSRLLSTPTQINFSSNCVTQSLSELASSATSSAGVATVEYSAISCTGIDTVTATTTDSDGNISTASVDIEISPDPEVIEVLGVGSGEAFQPREMLTGIAEGETLSYGASTTISVNVVDTNDSNILLSTPTTVSFSSACATQGLATIGASALSSAGTATVSYTASSCTGSDTVTAVTTDADGNTSTASIDFNISSLSLGRGAEDSFISGEMTTLTDGVDLTYGGDTLISVNVVDTNGNSLFTSSSVTLSFTSNCVQQGKSSISSAVATTTGTAVATYTANTCEGPDVITATLSDGTSASTNINVAEQVLGELAFVSASPKTIALRGSGSSANPEVTTVSFSLKDATGEPMAGEEIFYSLSTDVGGMSLANNSSVTDVDGNTSVQLTAGGVNVSVAVIATVTVEYGDGSNATTATTSDSIAVLGGLPDQDSFSLSVERFNPRGFDIDGSKSQMTIRAGDRFNNEARDGTQVSFVTTGGQIVGACELAGGVCSVDWTSSNPRPSNGLVHIMARTTGEESFIDANLNGQFDVGETIDEELDEAFIDSDYDGVRDANEFYSDFDNSETYDLKANPGFYQGASCSGTAELAGHCQTLVDVRQVATICMSEDDVLISDNLGGGVLDASGGPAEVEITITDGKGLMPASGTTVAVSVEDGEITAGSAIVVPNQCLVDGAGNPIPFTSTVVVEADDEPSTTSGLLKITVNRSDGVVEEHFVIFNH